MSHAQAGQFKSDDFESHFDKTQTDARRLAHVADILDADHAAEPLRLVLTYVSHVDSTGHKFGPDSPEIQQAILDTDAAIGQFVQRVIAWFDKTHAPADELYILLTTDHGMEAVHTSVNLDRLLGPDLVAGAMRITSGPVANIYLSDLPADQRTARADQIVAKLKPNDFLHVWKSQDVPREFHYADPTRVGAVVVLLKPGYNWISQRIAATLPARLSATHGYDPAECPNMLGLAIAWRYRHPLHHPRPRPDRQYPVACHRRAHPRDLSITPERSSRDRSALTSKCPPASGVVNVILQIVEKTRIDPRLFQRFHTRVQMFQCLLHRPLVRRAARPLHLLLEC